MEKVLVERNAAQDSGEENPRDAVNANPARDCIHGPVRLRRQAEQYLFHYTEDYKRKSLGGKYSWS
jgi:hypothetical protein